MTSSSNDMKSSDKSITSPENDKASPEGDSVFDTGPKAKPVEKQPTEHDGEHGANGRENDLDRAEEAGREQGAR